MNLMLLFASLAAILAVAGLVWLLQLGENRIGDAADIVKRVVKRVKLHKLLCRLQLLGAAAVEKAAHVAAAHGAV